ncbi:MAG: hypothetical protein H7232_16205 [Aeromicrobium sp.]|nr:hypothetical protein [Burkholderiales bacterium]
MKVLCVSPRFAPVNAADSHRLRLLLPHFAAHGCEVEVLAVDPACVPGPADAWLLDSVPATVPVHRVQPWRVSGWGLNGLAQRSFVSLLRKGNELLESGRFDLVFFSTTEFLLHGLGPLWLTRWRVPFCMDFQDPWVNDYYRQSPHLTPPGGRFKYTIMDALHRFTERAVVRRCSGFLSVSAAYLPMLTQRYGALVAHQPRLVAGFPGEPDELMGMRCVQPVCDAARAVKTWRYVGRGGADMAKAASAFFRAWRMAIDQTLLAAADVRFEAIGTSYAADGRREKSLEPLAVAAGLPGNVKETPARLGYSDMLRVLIASDALVVFGSDDPAYTASKIYPYLLAGKPLVAIFHEKSSVVSLMRAAGGGVCVTFNEQTTPEQLSVKIVQAWFAQRQFDRSVILDGQKFEPYTARSQASEVTNWFRQIQVVQHAA